MIWVRRNVGNTDRIFRAIIGAFLVWFGMIGLKGLEANVVGLLIAVPAMYLIGTAYTGKCLLFRMFKVHSLSKMECSMYGKPRYRKRRRQLEHAVQAH